MGQRLVKEGLGFQPRLPRCESRHPVPTTSERVSQNQESTTPGGSEREGTEERHMMIEGRFSRDTATLDMHAPHNRASNTTGQTPTERQEEQVNPVSQTETSVGRSSRQRLQRSG